MSQDLFQAPDYFQLDELLTEEHKLVRDAAREWVKRAVSPIIEEACQKAVFPKELIGGLAEIGAFGPYIPTEYGGAGLDQISYGLIMQELERGDSGVRSTASVQSSLVMYPIWKYGNEQQRKKYLPKLATGEFIGCFGLTEPNHGSDPGGMTTRATAVDGGYKLNGAKMWITNGTIADIAVVWAKCDDEKIRGFVVEKGMKGFTAPEMKHKWSLRASVTSELVFDDVFIPEENLLPNVVGLKGPLGCLNQARFGIGWGAIGAAMAVYEASVSYAKERVQFGKPIGGFQLIQDKLVWMLTEITKGQILALEVGRNKDDGSLRHQQVSMLKRNNVWVARECAKLAREIHGANGITGEYPIMRHLMNIESVYTYEGTHEMHTLVLGEDITGIPAYR